MQSPSSQGMKKTVAIVVKLGNGVIRDTHYSYSAQTTLVSAATGYLKDDYT